MPFSRDESTLCDTPDAVFKVAQPDDTSWAGIAFIVVAVIALGLILWAQMGGVH